MLLLAVIRWKLGRCHVTGHDVTMTSRWWCNIRSVGCSESVGCNADRETFIVAVTLTTDSLTTATYVLTAQSRWLVLLELRTSRPHESGNGALRTGLRCTLSPKTLYTWQQTLVNRFVVNSWPRRLVLRELGTVSVRLARRAYNWTHKLLPRMVLPLIEHEGDSVYAYS